MPPMQDPFDNAIRSLKEIALESAPRISVTLDLTGYESSGHPTPTDSATGPGLTIVHRPDRSDTAETQLVLDTLSILARAES